MTSNPPFYSVLLACYFRILLSHMYASSLSHMNMAVAVASPLAPSDTVTPSSTLVWMAPFFSGGGYCTEAYSMVVSAMRANISTAIGHHGDSFDQQYVDGLSGTETRTLQDLQQGKYTTADARRIISVCHSEPGAWYVPMPRYHTTRCPVNGAQYRIGRTMFETDRIPDGWVDRLHAMDEIWVPTEFAREVFEKSGVDPRKLVVIGEAVDTNFYAPVDLSVHSIHTLPPSLVPLWQIATQQTTKQVDTGKRFVFLFVGKWEKRKGVRLLVSSFFQEFYNGNSKSDSNSHSNSNGNDIKRNEPILAILTSAYHSTSDFMGEIRSILQAEGAGTDAVSSRSIVLLTRVPQQAMPVLYSLADMLVIPSHGEGWGRPHVEAMSCGVPVAATNWSGVTAYLTEANGYPVDIEGMVPADGWQGHRWAQPSGVHLRQVMRHAVDHPEEVRVKGLKAREDMITLFSLDALGDELSKHIQRIDSILDKRNPAVGPKRSEL